MGLPTKDALVMERRDPTRRPPPPLPGACGEAPPSTARALRGMLRPSRLSCRGRASAARTGTTRQARQAALRRRSSAHRRQRGAARRRARAQQRRRQRRCAHRLRLRLRLARLSARRRILRRRHARRRRSRRRRAHVAAAVGQRAGDEHHEAAGLQPGPFLAPCFSELTVRKVIKQR